MNEGFRRLRLVRFAAMAVSLGLAAMAAAYGQDAGRLPPASPEASVDQPPPAPQAPGNRFHPIQNGHRVQPSQGDLAKPDVSQHDAEIVDRLYRELMQEEHQRYPNLPPATAPSRGASPRP
ncbi:MAG TPA: hypothetical protein VKY65_16035 [Alphaproteobacteria bacterium]|nr:hypothetical protein [Alphaproteobacteria bacterium]